jgi:hypothetical protein
MSPLAKMQAFAPNGSPARCTHVSPDASQAEATGPWQITAVRSKVAGTTVGWPPLGAGLQATLVSVMPEIRYEPWGMLTLVQEVGSVPKVATMAPPQ